MNGCTVFPDCPMTEPHGHCSGRGCIVSVAEDGRVCADCDHAVAAWEDEQMKREELRQRWAEIEG